MPVFHITQSNYSSVENSDKTVLLDFYTDWCGPCRSLSPLIDEIAQENPQYLVGKINVNQERELAAKFGVSSVPTLAVMKNGIILRQEAGVKPKHQILKMLVSP